MTDYEQGVLDERTRCYNLVRCSVIRWGPSKEPNPTLYKLQDKIKYGAKQEIFETIEKLYES